MPDQTTTVAGLREAVRRFATDRAWEPYHSPKNLAMALCVEAAELLELFLWRSSEDSRRAAQDPARRAAAADELADVFILLLNLSLQLGIDLSEAFAAKLVKNAEKYPVDRPGPWAGGG